MHPKDAIKLSISLQMPSASSLPDSGTQKHEECHKTPIEDKIKECLENIISDRDSHQDWILVNKVYKSLCSKKKLSSRGRNLKKMIEPILAKFGYFKTSSNNTTK